ncbi:MAG: hypothetical protein ACTINL_04455 [Serratia proteamaculans]
MSILSVNTNAIFNVIGGGSPLSIINSFLHPSYSIRKSGDSATALEFSGMASIQPSGSAAIITAPVEKGRYQAINKVLRPGRVIAEIVINGLTGYSGKIPNIFDLTLTSQSDTLNTIKDMLTSVELYDIDTPKDTYTGYDLVDYAYSVTSQRGVTLLVVHLVFQQVIEQMEVTLSSKSGSKQQTTDSQSNSGTGTGASTKPGGTKGTTLSDLSKSWGNLKKDVGDFASKITDPITSGFTSAMGTVTKSLTEVGNSATNKLDVLVKDISKAVL